MALLEEGPHNAFAMPDVISTCLGGSLKLSKKLVGGGACMQHMTVLGFAEEVASLKAQIQALQAASRSEPAARAQPGRQAPAAAAPDGLHTAGQQKQSSLAPAALSALRQMPVGRSAKSSPAPRCSVLAPPTACPDVDQETLMPDSEEEAGHAGEQPAAQEPEEQPESPAEQACRRKRAEVLDAGPVGCATPWMRRAAEGMCAGRKRKLLARPRRYAMQRALAPPAKRSTRNRAHALAHLRSAAACVQPLGEQHMRHLPTRLLLA